MSRSVGYKCYNIHCNSCIGKTLCGEPGDMALNCVDRIISSRTNADRIRSMSDEELANEMRKRSISTICDIVCQGECKAIATLNKTSNEVCKEIIIKWLQQSAKEDA